MEGEEEDDDDEEEDDEEEEEDDEEEEEEDEEEEGDCKTLFFWELGCAAIIARRTRALLLRLARPTFWVRSVYFGNEGVLGGQGVEHDAPGRRI